MDEPYKKREVDILMTGIDKKFDDVHKKLDDNNSYQNKELAEIKLMVGQTNGKVADVQKWRERVTGAGWALGITTTLIVIPLLTWAFVTVSSLDDKIDEGIKSALSNYEKIDVK